MKKLLALLILLGAGAVGWAYWHSLHRTNVPAEDLYTYATVDYGTLTESVSATGLLQPHEIIAVGSELSGRVTEVFEVAEINKVVKAGQPLLKLDDQLARLKLKQAQTAVLLAKADVKRAEAARDGDKLRVERLRALPPEIGQRKELDEAEMRLKAAEATVHAAGIKVQETEDLERQAQYGVDLTTVRVPGGSAKGEGAKDRTYTILDKKVVFGQLIAPPVSAQLFTLASDLGKMRVHTQVGENDIGKIRMGLTATFTVYAYAEEETRFEGKVVEIRPMPVSQHGAVFYDTVIEVDNQRDANTHEWMLRPGMTATVDIVLRTHKDAWKVPTAALNFQPDESQLSDAAREKVATWQSKEKREDWKPVWTRDEMGKAFPIYIRLGGTTEKRDTGINSSEYAEVLQWDPDVAAKLNPKTKSTYPEVITGLKPNGKKGMFEKFNVKLF